MSQRPPGRAPTCFVLFHYYHLNNEVQIYIFSARQLICLARYMLSPVRPSAIDRHTGASVKTVEGRIIKFSPYGVFHPEIITGFPKQGRQIREGWETCHLLALNVNISKTVRDRSE